MAYLCRLLDGLLLRHSLSSSAGTAAARYCARGMTNDDWRMTIGKWLFARYSVHHSSPHSRRLRRSIFRLHLHLSHRCLLQVSVCHDRIHPASCNRQFTVQSSLINTSQLALTPGLKILCTLHFLRNTHAQQLSSPIQCVDDPHSLAQTISSDIRQIPDPAQQFPGPSSSVALCPRLDAFFRQGGKNLISLFLFLTHPSTPYLGYLILSG